MPLEEGYQAHRLLMRLLYLGMDEILSDGQDGLPASPSSMLLLPISAPGPPTPTSHLQT